MLSQAFSSDRRRFQSPLSQLFGSLLRGRSRRRSRSKQVQAALTSEVLEQRALLTNLVGIDMGGGTLITGWTQYSSTSDSTLNNLMGESGPTGIDVFIDHDSSPGTNVDFNPPASQLPIHTTSLAGIDRAYSDLGNIEFNFSDLTAGQDYEIYVFAGNDLNGNQKVTITGASSFDFNQPHSVNQLLVNGTTGDSTMQLADYAVVMTADGSGNIKVRVDSSPNPGGFFGVSGIAIQEVAPAMAPVIIDDGDTGFAIESGSWGNGVAGANGDNRNASIWNGDKVASWTFDGLTPGVYRVSATWFPHAVRATDAPFTVFDGMMPLATVDVNQQLSPSGVPGVNDLGRQWEDLGNDLFRITGNTLKVELSNDANGYVIADAVRIERIGELPPPPVIVDDGDPGFAIESGSWGTGNAGAGGDNRNASIFGGPKVASWTFDSLTPGVYRVSTTWVPSAARATDAPFTLFDGFTPITTVDVNQQLAPSGSPDLMDLGVLWQNLAGNFNVTGNTLVVKLSNDANGYVMADAVRIERVADFPQVIDDGDDGFAIESGSWGTGNSGAFGDNRNASIWNGNKVASWTFTGLTAGTYRVSATWAASLSRATDAPYTIFDGATSLTTIDANQQQAPDDFTEGGIHWEDLTTVLITGDTLVVQLSNDANNYVMADAIRIQRVDGLPPAP